MGSSNHDFWWNWWIQFAVAVGTTLTVAVALVKDIILDWLRPVKLLIMLKKSVPDIEQCTTRDGKSRKVRYYHVNIAKNNSRTAKHVRVYLLQISVFGQNQRWSGEVPLRWRDQELYPLTHMMTVGPPTDCDLCHVIKGEGDEGHSINIEPLIRHQSLDKFLSPLLHGPVDMVLSLQARADEGVSDHSFRIKWDEKWEDSNIEMSKHLVISQIT